MKIVYERLKLVDELRRSLASRLGKEQAYLLEEKLTHAFSQLSEIEDAINNEINKTFKDEPPTSIE